MKTVKLREVAHMRPGEKIDLMNIAIMAWREEDYPIIRDQLTLERMRDFFAPVSYGNAVRYELPNLSALNFVFDGMLSGGRTRTIALEESGRLLTCMVYDLTLEVPDNYVGRSEYFKTTELYKSLHPEAK